MPHARQGSPGSISVSDARRVARWIPWRSSQIRAGRGSPGDLRRSERDGGSLLIVRAGDRYMVLPLLSCVDLRGTISPSSEKEVIPCPGQADPGQRVTARSASITPMRGSPDPLITAGSGRSAGSHTDLYARLRIGVPVGTLSPAYRTRLSPLVRIRGKQESHGWCSGHVGNSVGIPPSYGPAAGPICAPWHAPLKMIPSLPDRTRTRQAAPLVPARGGSPGPWPRGLVSVGRPWVGGVPVWVRPPPGPLAPWPPIRAGGPSLSLPGDGGAIFSKEAMP